MALDISRVSLIVRFMERVNHKANIKPVIDGIDGNCWIWQGTIANNGYGKIPFRGNFNGKDVNGDTAHRIAYQLFVGPIPEGMDVHHKCYRIQCVNPEHLEAITHIENVRHAYATRADRRHRGYLEPRLRGYLYNMGKPR